MAALTAARDTQRLGAHARIDLVRIPVAANAVIQQGGIVCTNAAGFAVPGTVSTTLKCWGIALTKVDATGKANGDLVMEVRRGTFAFFSGTAGDAIAQANVGATVYIMDDQTVGLTNGGATRSVAGVVMQVMDSFIWVEI